MNIFYLDPCPVQAAQWMCDKHVVKMILETAQLLSTAHRVLDGTQIESVSKSGRKVKRWVLPDERENVLYSATHINHPSAVWCRESQLNYKWLVKHFAGLCWEYNRRYNKNHKTSEISDWLEETPHNLKKYQFTNPPNCMDAKYIISNNPVLNYQQYYRVGKAHIHAWKNCNPPPWINNSKNIKMPVDSIINTL